MRRLLVLVSLTITSLISGCAHQQLPESPICVPEREVLSEISFEEQKQIYELNPELLYKVADNDAKLKSQTKALESLIREHDRRLTKGECYPE